MVSVLDLKRGQYTLMAARQALFVATHLQRGGLDLFSISRIRKWLGPFPSFMSLLTIPMLLVALSSSNLPGQLPSPPVEPDRHPCPIPGGAMGLHKPTVYRAPGGGALCDWRLDEQRSLHHTEADSDHDGGFVTVMGPMSGASPQREANLYGLAAGTQAWMTGWAYDSKLGSTSVSLQLSGWKTVRWYAVEESPFVRLNLYGKGTSQVEIVSPTSAGFVVSETTFESNLIGNSCTWDELEEGDEAQATTAQGGSSVGIGPFQVTLQGNFGAGVYPGLGWEWAPKWYECCADNYEYISSTQIAGQVQADGYLIPIPVGIGVFMFDYSAWAEVEARIDIYGVAHLQCDCP